MLRNPNENPAGEYAIAELFGRSTVVGRIEESERFGAKMLILEPQGRDTLLLAVFHGGAAIDRLALFRCRRVGTATAPGIPVTDLYPVHRPHVAAERAR